MLRALTSRISSPAGPSDGPAVDAACAPLDGKALRSIPALVRSWTQRGVPLRRRSVEHASATLRSLAAMIGFFIQRPIFASAIAIIMVLAGAICYFLLPVSQFPDITPPQVVVSANYPGASAQVVADTVTTPLEQQINGVEGMTYMSSSSSNDGSSTITITFDVGYPLEHRRRRRAEPRRRRPRRRCRRSSIRRGVTIKKQNPNFVLIVNLTSPDGSVDPVALQQLRLSADRRSAEAPAGRRRRADLRRAALFDAHLARSRQARQSRHHRGRRPERRSPSRTSRSPPARSASRRRRPARPSRCRSTRVGRLSDPAAVRRHRRARRSRERRRGAAARCRPHRARRAAIFVVRLLRRRPDRGARRSTRCRAPTRSICSSASRTRWRSCRSASRRASPTPCTTTRRASSRPRCMTCVITLGEALLLVVAVVFIFLQSWRTTIIPTIAIPVSLIATLAVMQMLGFSLNMLSLLGMVLAIGLVVDDAIVVVENVERQLEAGLQPLAAARAAMTEVTGPIIATTAVLMAVFVPVAFIPGVAGRLYNQFALTVAISVGISAFNSLTLSPALSAAFLRHRGDDAASRRSAGSTPASTGCRTPMRAACAALIRLRWAHAGAVRRRRSARTYCDLARASPRPSCRSRTRAISSSSSSCRTAPRCERTDAVAKQVRDILQATPGVDIVGSISGLNFLTSAAQSNSAVEFAILKPWDERGAGAERLEASSPRCAPKLLGHPGRHRAELRSAVDPRPRRHRRLRIPGRGSHRTRQRSAERRDAGADRRGAQAAGAQSAAAVLVVQHLDAAVQLRPRPQQGEAARASTCRTCSTRCRSISARSTSTTSTCSAAPSA